MTAQGGKRKGAPKDHVTTDGGERNEADEKDVEQHSSHGKGPADVRDYVSVLHDTRPNGRE